MAQHGDDGELGCDHAWALRYIAGIRDREIPWHDIELGLIEVVRPGDPITDPARQCTTKERSASLGKAMHAIGEGYYRGQKVDWSGLPGRIFASGIHLLPKLKDCEHVEVEHAIGTRKLPGKHDARAVSVVLDVEGLALGGFRDLLVQAPVYAATLEVRAVGGLVLLDYKSTSNVLEYAKTAAELVDDVQACAYALDVMDRFRLDAVACRWVYFETKKIRRAIPVDVVVTRAHAFSILRAQIPLARRLDAIQDVASAKRNPLACEAYGKPGVINCSHHVCNGGTCDVRRPVSVQIKLAQIRAKKEETKLAEQTELERKKAEFAARMAAKKAAAGGAENPAEVAPAAPAPAKTRAPRAPKAAAVVEPEPAPEPEAPTACSDVVGRIAALRAELDAVTTERDELRAELDAVQEALA